MHVIIIHCRYDSVCQFKRGLFGAMVWSKTISAIKCVGNVQFICYCYAIYVERCVELAFITF